MYVSLSRGSHFETPFTICLLSPLLSKVTNTLPLGSREKTKQRIKGVSKLLLFSWIWLNLMRNFTKGVINFFVGVPRNEAGLISNLINFDTFRACIFPKQLERYVRGKLWTGWGRTDWALRRSLSSSYRHQTRNIRSVEERARHHYRRHYTPHQHRRVWQPSIPPVFFSKTLV